MTGTRIRAALSLGAKVTAGLPFTTPQHLQPCSLLRSIPLQTNPVAGLSTSLFGPARNFSSQQITKNLHLMTPEDEKLVVDHKSMIVQSRKDGKDRPLVVLLEWMAAQRKHVNKFTDLYLGSGYDVLVAPLSPRQLLFPVTGGKLVAEDLVRFLAANPAYNNVMVHGFSVGGYLWGEACLTMAKYPSVPQRFVGQVWDSIVDVVGVGRGVATALFPKSHLLRGLVESMIQLHLFMFKNIATKHYKASSDCFKESPVKVPALLLLSRSDPICSFKENIEVREKWSQEGTPVSIKIWDKSPHVGHLRKHRKEYIEELNKFLASIHLPTVTDLESGTPPSKL